MERRDFIRSGVVVTAALSLELGMPLWLKDAFASGKTDLVAVLGGDSPAAMLQRAMPELGGIERFVKRGDKVVIKPNIGWARTAEYAANTNPELIGELVRMAVDAGAGRVEVFDHTCQEWRKCYASSGIRAVVEANGGVMVPGNSRSYYATVALPEGRVLKKTEIHKSLIESDVWFNVPVIKHHGGAGMSIAMKNNMGIVWDRRIFHRNDLQQCIADLCSWEKQPTLNIVDGFRSMIRNGPAGVSTEDAALTKALFASTDQVAVDTAAMKFFAQLRPVGFDQVAHLKKGQKSGIGTTDLSSLNITRVKL